MQNVQIGRYSGCSGITSFSTQNSGAYFFSYQAYYLLTEIEILSLTWREGAALPKTILLPGEQLVPTNWSMLEYKGMPPHLIMGTSLKVHLCFRVSQRMNEVLGWNCLLQMNHILSFPRTSASSLTPSQILFQRTSSNNRPSHKSHNQSLFLGKTCFRHKDFFECYFNNSINVNK